MQTSEHLYYNFSYTIVYRNDISNDALKSCYCRKY